MISLEAEDSLITFKTAQCLGALNPCFHICYKRFAIKEIFCDFPKHRVSTNNFNIKALLVNWNQNDSLGRVPFVFKWARKLHFIILRKLDSTGTEVMLEAVSAALSASFLVRRAHQLSLEVAYLISVAASPDTSGAGEVGWGDRLQDTHDPQGSWSSKEVWAQVFKEIW